MCCAKVLTIAGREMGVLSLEEEKGEGEEEEDVIKLSQSTAVALIISSASTVMELRNLATKWTFGTE